jgi:hypothetical protein
MESPRENGSIGFPQRKGTSRNKHSISDNLSAIMRERRHGTCEQP